MKVDINNLMKLADAPAMLLNGRVLVKPEDLKALCEVVLKAQAYLDAYDNGVSFIDALSSFGETQDALR